MQVGTNHARIIASLEKAALSPFHQVVELFVVLTNIFPKLSFVKNKVLSQFEKYFCFLLLQLQFGPNLSFFTN